MLSCLISSLVLTLLDTAYFDATRLWPPRLIVTPLNSLLFNLSTENLSKHGIHPRYLHFLVNLPMLFGVGVYAVGESIVAVLRLGKEKSNEQFMRIRQCDSYSKCAQLTSSTVYLSAIIFPTLLLSIQPHQEPRFLLPLIVPLILLLSKSSLFRYESPRIRHYRRIFWVSSSCLRREFWLISYRVDVVDYSFVHPDNDARRPSSRWSHTESSTDQRRAASRRSSHFQR